MNKFGMVLGVAAVATLAGCKDPDYKHAATTPASQNEVRIVETTPEPSRPVVVEQAPRKCTCPPGTRHVEPCPCGALDCQCIVVPKPVAPVDVPKAVEPAYTIYVVQSGDFLAKISKKFNVTIDAIKRYNPSIKKDVVRVGQKLKIPGRVDVGDQPAPKAVAEPVSKKTTFSAYAGATKEYVVKNGDTLGSIAYGNGINIRQLKALNNLSSDSLKIGQKLKIPAEKVAKQPKATAKKESAKAAAPEAKKASEPAKAALETKETPAPAAASAAAGAQEAASVPAPEAQAEAPAAAPAATKPEVATTTYVVQEGDDMTGVSIRWGVSAAEIRELNNLAEGAQLVPGQIIKLPADAQQ